MEGKHFIKLNQVNVSLIVCFTNVLPYMIDKLKRLFFKSPKPKTNLRWFFFKVQNTSQKGFCCPLKCLMNLYQVYHRTSPPVRANTSLSSWSKVSSLNFGWSVKGRSHSVTDWVLYHQNNEDFNPDDDALIRETRFQHGGWTWQILWSFVTSTKKQNSILRSVLVSLALEVLQFFINLFQINHKFWIC